MKFSSYANPRPKPSKMCKGKGKIGCVGMIVKEDSMTLLEYNNIVICDRCLSHELPKYRLTIHPDMDNDNQLCMTQEFITKEELVAGIETSAKLLLFLQDEMQRMPDRSNMFITEEMVNGIWEEVEVG